MKVDLLRQLDEWGNHLEATIEHVDAEEVVGHLRDVEPETLVSAPVRPARPPWRFLIRVAGVADPLQPQTLRSKCRPRARTIPSLENPRDV